MGAGSAVAQPHRMPFRVLWWSRAISFAGDGIGRTALVLYAATHGATAVGAVLLAVALPRFLGPIAGALADRLDQRRLMAVCETGQAVVFALLAVLLPPLPVLVVFVLVSGCFATAFVPAGRSAVPALVPAEGLGRANALLGTAFNIQLAVGPTIGGLAVELGGARVAFAVNALTFVVSALVLTRLPALPPAGGHGGLWAETIAGLRFVATTPGPRALVASLFITVSFAAIDNVALVFLVAELGGSAADFGLTQAAYGVGMLAASGLLVFVAGTRSAVAMLLGGGHGHDGAGARAVAGGGGTGGRRGGERAGERRHGHARAARHATAPAGQGFRRGGDGGPAGVGGGVCGGGPAGEGTGCAGRVSGQWRGNGGGVAGVAGSAAC
jgi:MFS family permease